MSPRKPQAGSTSMWSSSRCLRLPLMPAPPLLSTHIPSHPTTSSFTTSLLFLSYFRPSLMTTSLRLLYTSLSISLLFSHLLFLYSHPMLPPVLFSSSSDCFFSFHHAGCLLASRPAAYPPYSLISADYFSGGASCVLTPT